MLEAFQEETKNERENLVCNKQFVTEVGLNLRTIRNFVYLENRTNRQCATVCTNTG